MSGSDPAGVDVFHIQPMLLAADYREKLFGAFVERPDNPNWNYKPKDNRAPLKTLPPLDPTPVIIHNFEQIVSQLHATHFKVGLLHSLAAIGIEVDFSQSKAKTSTTHAALARHWYMDSPPEKLEALFASDKALKDELYEMIERSGRNEVYWVTHMVTMQRVTRTNSTETSHGVDTSLALPEPVSGLAPETGISYEHSKTIQQSAQFPDEMIVCLGYHRIFLDRVDGFRASFAALVKRRKGYTWGVKEIRGGKVQIIKLDPTSHPGQKIKLGDGDETAGSTENEVVTDGSTNNESTEGDSQESEDLSDSAVWEKLGFRILDIQNLREVLGE